MESYGPATYGDRIADIYDERYGGRVARADELALLASLAGEGPVLELAIGTGRVALPLAERGITVHGIDASQSMVDQMRAKPGGDAVAVTIGDMRIAPPPGGPYALVYVVFNSFFCLCSAADQVACFAHVARHLRPGGHFVLEAFVPDPARFRDGQGVHATAAGVDRADVRVSRLDTVTQRVDTVHVAISETGIRLLPVQVRYSYPSELDLMAQLAGLTLDARYGGWDGEPFTAASGNHVSVWRK